MTQTPAYVFRAYTGKETPVRVDRPRLTQHAAKHTPVQVWRSDWTGTDRVLRYRATCASCGTPVWGFDDGENDPRGPLGDSSAGYSLDPREYGATGPTVGLCARCGNEQPLYARGLERARKLWR